MERTCHASSEVRANAETSRRRKASKGKKKKKGGAWPAGWGIYIRTRRKV